MNDDEVRTSIVGTIELAIALSEQEVGAALTCVSTTYRDIQSQVGEFEILSKAVDSYAGASRAATDAHDRFSQGVANELAVQVQLAQRANHLVTDVEKFTRVIGNIAVAAKILTINANIEAAHAGKTKASAFGTIAVEMRNLANEISLANASITEIAAALAAILPQIGSRAEKLSVDVATAASTSNAASTDGLDRVATAVALSLERAKANADAMNEGATEVFGHLQFQDRMAQQLREIGRRLEKIGTRASVPDGAFTTSASVVEAPPESGARHLFEASQGPSIELF